MVGSGQLARMTAQAAVSLGIEFRVLAESASDSAAQVCAGTVIGDYRSAGDLLAFGSGCDVVTFDHEHVPGVHLAVLEGLRPVRPSRTALRFTQDKRAMRDRISRLSAKGVIAARCPQYQPVASMDEVLGFAGSRSRRSAAGGANGQGWPVVLKATSGGYDGRGVWVCHDRDTAAQVLSYGIGLIAEELVAFDTELAVLVARSPSGQGAAYPVVQTIQEDGICREVIAPAPDLDPELAEVAQQVGLTLAAELGVTGLLAVELFQAGSELIVNELAMRPHNCGHWTIDGAVTSQFEQHLRAVLDLPLGSPRPKVAHAVMVNVLGGDEVDLHSRLPHVQAADPGARVHLYGKAVRPGRKVGHVTVTGENLAGLRDRARRAASYLSLGTEAGEPGETAEGPVAVAADGARNEAPESPEGAGQ
jgi:5-(carboxyamino)imidazole ribonucleotide synthase